MIIILTVTVLIISFFDIKSMLEKGLKKEIVVFVIFAVLTLAFGYSYIPNKQNFSLVGRLFDFFKIQY